MGSVFRLALMWLLAVALPLQGASAASMLVCGVGVHSVADPEAATHPHGTNTMPADHVHRHHGAVHRPLMADSSSPDTPHAGHAAAHKCPICASCCFGTAVSCEPVAFAGIRLTDFHPPLVNDFLAAFLTSGIERPPRSVFA